MATKAEIVTLKSSVTLEIETHTYSKQDTVFSKQDNTINKLDLWIVNKNPTYH